MKDPRTNVLRLLADGADDANQAMTDEYFYPVHRIDPTMRTWNAIREWADLIDAFVEMGEVLHNRYIACEWCLGSGMDENNHWYKCADCRANGVPIGEFMWKRTTTGDDGSGLR